MEKICGHTLGLVCKECYTCGQKIKNHEKRHIALKECAICDTNIGIERAKDGWLICRKCEEKIKPKIINKKEVLEHLYNVT